VEYAAFDYESQRTGGMGREPGLHDLDFWRPKGCRTDMEERGAALSLVLHERASVNRSALSGLNRTPSGFFLQAMSEQDWLASPRSRRISFFEAGSVCSHQRRRFSK
jgi:hypothetical protein